MLVGLAMRFVIEIVFKQNLYVSVFLNKNWYTYKPIVLLVVILYYTIVLKVWFTDFGVR